MTGPELLQFKAIRTVAAALISVSIILLWLVAIKRPLRRCDEGNRADGLHEVAAPRRRT